MANQWIAPSAPENLDATPYTVIVNYPRAAASHDKRQAAQDAISSALRGALLLLAQPENWESLDGEMSADFIADAFAACNAATFAAWTTEP